MQAKRLPTNCLAKKALEGSASTKFRGTLVFPKTTIHRHWPSRAPLLMDACSKIWTCAGEPRQRRLKRRCYWLVTGLAQQLKSARWAGVLPAIIDAAEREPALAQLLARLHSGQMVPLQLAPGTNVSEFVASIVAPFFYRRSRGNPSTMHL